MLNTPCPSLLFFFILVELKWGLGDKAPHSQSQLRNWLSAKTEDRIPEKLKSVIEARWLFPSGCENPHIGRSLDRALRFVFNKVSGSISFSYCPIPRLTLDFFFPSYGAVFTLLCPHGKGVAILSSVILSLLSTCAILRPSPLSVLAFRYYAGLPLGN